MNTGKVKFFNENKGFGFIVDDETDKDIFVHVSGIADGHTIKEEDSVEFEIGEGKKGPVAENVKPV